MFRSFCLVSFDLNREHQFVLIVKHRDRYHFMSEENLRALLDVSVARRTKLLFISVYSHDSPCLHTFTRDILVMKPGLCCGSNEELQLVVNNETSY